jgi:hypothetical protein
MRYIREIGTKEPLVVLALVTDRKIFVDSKLFKAFVRFLMKTAQIATKLRVKRRANHLNPLRDGSEKFEGFTRGARETMVVRYKSSQLRVVGWSA